MNIQELESVCAVDQYRNYSEAAYYSASSLSVISKHVSRVEAELGVRLFERATKVQGVERTPAGNAILPLLHEMLSAYKTARSAARSIKQDFGSLKIGYTPLVGNFREAEILFRFMSKYSNIQVFRVIDSRENLLHMLENDSVDAIMLPLMIRQGEDPIGFYGIDKMHDFRYDHIITNRELHLGLPREHPLANCEMITRDMFPKLKDEVFLFSTRQSDSVGVEQWQYMRQHLGIEPKDFKTRIIDFAEPTLARRMVEMRAGVLPQSCFVPKYMGDMVFVPVEGWEYEVSSYLIYKESHMRGSLKKFREVLEDYKREKSENS